MQVADQESTDIAERGKGGRVVTTINFRGRRFGDRRAWAAGNALIATLLLVPALIAAMTISVTTPASASGSATWSADKSYPAPFNPVAIACPSASVCEAVGRGALDQAAVMGSTNGGSTWTAQSVPAGITGLYDVVCASTAVCEAGGFSGQSLMGGAPVVVGTTNGGATWALQTLPSDMGNYVADIVCPTISACISVGYGDSGTYTGFPAVGAMAGTTNGGATWTLQTLPSDTYQIGSLVCPSANVCETLGENGADAAVVLGTTNGGTTWTVQTTLTSSTQNFSGAIVCASTQVCEALGTATSGSVILGTTSGGVTWTAADRSFGDRRLLQHHLSVHHHVRGVGQEQFGRRCDLWYEQRRVDMDQSNSSFRYRLFIRGHMSIHPGVRGDRR